MKILMLSVNERLNAYLMLIELVIITSETITQFPPRYQLFQEVNEMSVSVHLAITITL